MMFNSLRLFLVLILGVGLGGLYQWYTFHNANNLELSDDKIIESVIQYADTPILEENYRCEGEPLKTAGQVLASLITLNAHNKVNRLSYGCFDGTCTLSYNDCKPWQELECSARFLIFDENEDKTIKTETFTCLDMP